MECVFFFQAEDGIRDLVRSRGLGDVYKRQVNDGSVAGAVFFNNGTYLGMCGHGLIGVVRTLESVSYTHLTLPTSDLV